MRTTYEGQRKPQGKTAWLSMIDLTPWQIEQLLPVVIQITVQDYMDRKTCAVKVNVNDIVTLIGPIVEKEDIIVPTPNGERWRPYM